MKNDTKNDIARLIKMTDTMSIVLDGIQIKISERNAIPAGKTSGGGAGAPPPVSARRIVVAFQANRKTSATVDDYRPFGLSRLLGELLRILAMDKGGYLDPSDPMVGFKDKAEIVSDMAKMFGRNNFTPGALRQALYRLRLLLSSNGFAGLLECEKIGYRVAVLRTDPGVAAAPTGP